jgi:transposase
MATVDTTLIFQPPYSPELNPIERLFEYLRDKIDGRNYPSLQAKMAAVDRELRRLAARPKAVRQLIGYDWMQAALDALPEPEFMSSV